LDRFAFHTYIGHFLAPTLKAGEIIVMDNLSVHKSKRVRELIEGARASLLFLPPYSPDFNPIEETTSKLKGILRKTQANTPQALLEATGGALDAVSAKDNSGMVRCLRTQSAGTASL
jgi:transposase